MPATIIRSDWRGLARGDGGPECDARRGAPLVVWRGSGAVLRRVAIVVRTVLGDSSLRLDLTDRLRAHIAARRPNVFLLGRTADVIFHEANDAVGRQ